MPIAASTAPRRTCWSRPGGGRSRGSRGVSWVLAAVVTLVVCAPGSAQPTDPTRPTERTTPSPTARPTVESPLETIYVPDKNGDLVPVLPQFKWEELEKFFLQGQRTGGSDPGAMNVRATVRSVKVRGEADYDRAILTVTMSVRLLAEGWSPLPWELADLLLTEAPTWRNAAGEAIGEVLDIEEPTGTRRLWLSGTRQTEGELTLTLVRPVKWEDDRYHMMLGLPWASVNDLELVLPAGAVALPGETETAPSPRMQRRPDGRVVLKVWPQAEKLDVVWTRTDGYGTAGQVPLSAVETATVTFDGQAKVLHDSSFVVTAEQGAFDDLWVRLPSSGTVIDSSATDGITREIVGERPLTTEDGVERGRFLHLHSETPQTRWVFSVQMDIRRKVDTTQPADEALPFEIVGAVRQSGTISLLVGPGWNLTWSNGTNVTRTEPDGPVAPVAKFRYEGRPASLTVRVRPREDRLRCDPVWTLAVESRQVRLVGKLSIVSAGAEEIVVDLPGWRVTSVEPASAIEIERYDPFAVPLRIPLVRQADSTPRVRTLTVRAERSLGPNETNLNVQLPRLASVDGAPPLVRVFAASDIRLTEQLDAMPGITPLVEPEQSTPSVIEPLGTAGSAMLGGDPSSVVVRAGARTPLGSTATLGGGTGTSTLGAGLSAAGSFPNTTLSSANVPSSSVTTGAETVGTATTGSATEISPTLGPAMSTGVGSTGLGTTGLGPTAGNGPTLSTSPTPGDGVVRRADPNAVSGTSSGPKTTDNLETFDGSQVLLFRDFREGDDRPFVATIERLQGTVSASGRDDLRIDAERVRLSQAYRVRINHQPRRSLDLFVPDDWITVNGADAALPTISVNGQPLPSAAAIWLTDEPRNVNATPTTSSPSPTATLGSSAPGTTSSSGPSQPVETTPLTTLPATTPTPGTLPTTTPARVDDAVDETGDEDADPNETPLNGALSDGPETNTSSPTPAVKPGRRLRIDLGTYRRDGVELSLVWTRPIPRLLPGQKRSLVTNRPTLINVSGLESVRLTVDFRAPLRGRVLPPSEPTLETDLETATTTWRDNEPGLRSGEVVVGDLPPADPIRLGWELPLDPIVGNLVAERFWVWTRLLDDRRLDRYVVTTRGGPESITFRLPLEVDPTRMQAIWAGKPVTIDASRFPLVQLRRPTKVAVTSLTEASPLTADFAAPPNATALSANSAAVVEMGKPLPAAMPVAVDPALPETIELGFTRPRTGFWIETARMDPPEIVGVEMPLPFVWLIETTGDRVPIGEAGGVEADGDWHLRGLLWQRESALSPFDLEQAFRATSTAQGLPTAPRSIVTGITGRDVSVTLVDRLVLILGVVLTSVAITLAVVMVPWLRSVPAAAVAFTVAILLMVVWPAALVWVGEAAVASLVIGGIAMGMRRLLRAKPRRQVMRVPPSVPSDPSQRARSLSSGSSMTRTAEGFTPAELSS